MTRTLTAMGRPVILSRVRLQRCAHTECDNLTRMALIMPLSDIEDDGTPGMGAVVFCATHIEEALLKLSAD